MTNTETAAGGNLDNASQFVKLASIKAKVETGKICLRIISKERKAEDGSKAKDLPESLALIVPDMLTVANCAEYPTLNALMLETMRNMQRDLAKSFAVKGESQVWHAELMPEKLEIFAAQQNESLGRLTLAELADFYSENADSFRAAYEVVSGKEVNEANAKQVDATLAGLLKRLAESEPIFASEKQESLLEIALENCDSPLVAKLTVKLQKAKKERIKALEAAADLGI